MTATATHVLAARRPVPTTSTVSRQTAAPRSAADLAGVSTTLPPRASRVPVYPQDAAAATYPTLIQRCGVGSSCDCPPHEKLAGVQRDLRRATTNGGTPLNAVTLSAMESAFGHDFSQVRVHAGNQADSAARAVGALAYTAGSDVVFAAGQYAPGTSRGRRLLAHELAHVVQQSAGMVSVSGAVSSPGDPLEQAADRAAEAVAEGRPVGPLAQAGQPAASRLHRTVGTLDCPANVASAPADPRAALTGIDGKARDMAQQPGSSTG
jgi:hypothetical protein